MPTCQNAYSKKWPERKHETMKTIGIIIGISLMATVSPAALRAQTAPKTQTVPKTPCYVLAAPLRTGNGPFEKCSLAACTRGPINPVNPANFSSGQSKICADEYKKVAPPGPCHALAPDFWKTNGDPPCSVTICTDWGYNPTTFSQKQVAVCQKAGAWYQPPKPRIKTYEADNGEKFKVDLGRLMGSPFGPPGVQVWIWEPGFDTVPHPTIFSCGGGGGEYAMTDLDHRGTGWFLVPSRSVLADIARDACSVAAAIRSSKKGPKPQSAPIVRTVPNTTKVTQGMTPDAVVAILGAPISTTTGATLIFYNYPHLSIVFTNRKVSEIHQIQ
jgi:hypothetical protein